MSPALASATAAGNKLAEARVIVAFGDMYAGLWVTKRSMDHRCLKGAVLRRYYGSVKAQLRLFFD